MMHRQYPRWHLQTLQPNPFGGLAGVQDKGLLKKKMRLAHNKWCHRRNYRTKPMCHGPDLPWRPKSEPAISVIERR